MLTAANAHVIPPPQVLPSSVSSTSTLSSMSAIATRNISGPPPFSETPEHEIPTYDSAGASSTEDTTPVKSSPDSSPAPSRPAFKLGDMTTWPTWAIMLVLFGILFLFSLMSWCIGSPESVKACIRWIGNFFYHIGHSIAESCREWFRWFR